MVRNKDIITTPRVKEMRREKKQARIIRHVIVITCIVVVLIGMVILSRIRPLLIDSISVEGTKVVDSSQIEKVTQDKISGYYALLFPRNNSLMYPKKQILNTIRESFPRLNTISITKDGFKHIVITVSERESAYLWCGDVFPEKDKTTCYFMDASGYMFAESPYFSGNVYFKWYGGNIGETPITQTILGSDLILKIGSFIESIKGLGIDLYAINIKKDDGVGELYISRPDSDGPKIIFKLEDDLSILFDNLSSSTYTDPMKTLVENGFKGISYIDLRYENKIYYK